jgi:hypothetical protein
VVASAAGLGKADSERWVEYVAARGSFLGSLRVHAEKEADGWL